MSIGREEHEARPGQWGAVIVAWALVSTPLAWGFWMTFRKALLLFGH